MPKSDRQTYKRELDRASENIDGALEHIMRIAVEFEQHHPEVSTALELAATVLVEGQNLLKQVNATI